MTNRLLVAILFFMVAGCQSQHPVAQTSTDLMGDFSPVGSFEIQRRQNFILPFDATFYIANPVNTIVTDSGVDVNALLATRLKDGFSQHFSRVFTGLSKERFNQALRSSREMGAQFLVFGFVEQWSNIQPVEIGECKGAQCSDAPGSDKESGDARVAISIYEAASGKLVDILTVRSRRGVASYIYEDNQGPLDNIVAGVLELLSEKR